jgi:ribosomal protein S18 acetylase RimI-like enzyme
MTKIRPARLSESPEILEVYISGGEWLPYTDISEVNKSVKENENGKVSLIVAEINGKIAGALKLHRPQAHIGKGGKIAVLPEFRGQGIGKLLYKSAIKIFDMEGRRKVIDSLVGENPTIKKMFESLGFEIEATMRKQTPGKKTLYQFAYHIDEKGVPELGEEVEFDIPATKYMEDNRRNVNDENNKVE